MAITNFFGLVSSATTFFPERTLYVPFTCKLVLVIEEQNNDL